MEIVTIILFLTAYVLILALKKDTRDILASQPKLRRKDDSSNKGETLQ